jgi:hypothetical protein
MGAWGTPIQGPLGHAYGAPVIRLWGAWSTPMRRLGHAYGAPGTRLWGAWDTPMGRLNAVFLEDGDLRIASNDR